MHASSIQSCVGTTPPYDAVFDMSGNAGEWEDSCSGERGGGDLCRVRGGGPPGSSSEGSCAMDELARRDQRLPGRGLPLLRGARAEVSGAQGPGGIPPGTCAPMAPRAAAPASAAARMRSSAWAASFSTVVAASAALRPVKNLMKAASRPGLTPERTRTMGMAGFSISASSVGALLPAAGADEQAVEELDRRGP